MTHRTAQIWSFLFMTAGCVLIVATFDPYQRGVFATGLAFAPGLLLVGLGEGMATTVTDLIQSAPPPEEVGDVTGLSRSGAYLGSSLGVALAGAFMTTSLLYLFEAGTDGSTVLPPSRSNSSRRRWRIMSRSPRRATTRCGRGSTPKVSQAPRPTNSSG